MEFIAKKGYPIGNIRIGYESPKCKRLALSDIEKFFAEAPKKEFGRLFLNLFVDSDDEGKT